MLTIEPPSPNSGTAAAVHRKVLPTLTRTQWSNSAGSRSSTRPVGPAMPTLLTSPVDAAHLGGGSLEQPGHLGLVGDVVVSVDGGVRIDVGAEHLGTVSAGRGRNGCADACAGPGHHDSLAFQHERHVTSQRGPAYTAGVCGEQGRSIYSLTAS